MSEHMTELQMAFVLICMALSSIARVWKSSMEGDDLVESVGFGLVFGCMVGIVVIVTVAAPVAVIICVVTVGVLTAVHKIAVRVKGT